MPINDLLNIPNSDQEWAIWSFSHRDSHTRIRQAIETQKGVNLTEYELEPINFENFQSWLEKNQQSHEDFNSALGLQSSDLEEVDPKNRSQLEVWAYLHWQEHQTAELQLKI